MSRPALSQKEIAGITQAIMAARLRDKDRYSRPIGQKAAEEGGCGVVGFAASVPVSGKHIFEPSIQMHNRGNGKGGGIAAAGFPPEQMGVDADTLRQDYILQVALLDHKAEQEVEEACIKPFLRIDHKDRIQAVADYRDLGLDVKPPDVVRYFVRVKDKELDRYASELGLADAPRREVEDEFIFQNSRRLNERFYASLGDQQAFVLSHARNLIILKIVGYAETVVQYYGMDDFKAKAWIAHQRYPTKGRVWHPGGSHPFIGMNEALVHNGDFANYYAVSEYLHQHGIHTQFLTDTEVSVILFDLFTRVYKYPMEYVIEAMAPTTELDFERLPSEKQSTYRAIQSLHLHSSPDGPWFFIVARSQPDQHQLQLMGITDTSMLRPQVFALQEGDVSIGLVASEKQAIDATLSSLHEEDPRFRLVADRYWNARGGSHTDGGAFIFTVSDNGNGTKLICQDKFGREVKAPAGEYKLEQIQTSRPPAEPKNLAQLIEPGAAQTREVFQSITRAMAAWDFPELCWTLAEIQKTAAESDAGKDWALELLTLLNNRRYDCGTKKRSMVLQQIRQSINHVLDQVPAIQDGQGGRYRRIDWHTCGALRAPAAGEEVLVICAQGFAPEGNDCDSRLEVLAYQLGWRRFIIYRLRGQRFQGCGLGPETSDVRIDLYGASGDYVASGIDGLELHIHDNGQDQLAQIIKAGRLVVHGDVGQAFMYGAKGGEVFVMGNGAGRPLINSVGRPRVVINGTCLDFLAESFMAGDPLNGGGFVVLNGLEFNDNGQVVPLELPYPGSNLFSLASGGALYVRDPHKLVIDEQLNGGQISQIEEAEWRLIRPYLETNEELFGISIDEHLLMVDGGMRSPVEVYRKVTPKKLAVLAKEAVPE
jgi:glutamate synthase domain-containing protein 1/glutamate synthase domain-containing protein 3